MSNPIQRAKEAARVWRKWVDAHVVINMTAVEFGHAARMEDSIDALEEPRLTATEREAVEVYREEYGKVVGTRWRGIQAILDAHFPPEPAHKPCVCGQTTPMGRGITTSVSGNVDVYHVSCICGRATEYKTTEAEAWAAWDKRA